MLVFFVVVFHSFGNVMPSDDSLDMDFSLQIDDPCSFADPDPESERCALNALQVIPKRKDASKKAPQVLSAKPGATDDSETLHLIAQEFKGVNVKMMPLLVTLMDDYMDADSSQQGIAAATQMGVQVRDMLEQVLPKMLSIGRGIGRKEILAIEKSSQISSQVRQALAGIDEAYVELQNQTGALVQIVREIAADKNLKFQESTNVGIKQLISGLRTTQLDLLKGTRRFWSELSSKYAPFVEKGLLTADFAADTLMGADPKGLQVQAAVDVAGCNAGAGLTSSALTGAGQFLSYATVDCDGTLESSSIDCATSLVSVFIDLSRFVRAGARSIFDCMGIDIACFGSVVDAYGKALKALRSTLSVTATCDDLAVGKEHCTSSAIDAISNLATASHILQSGKHRCDKHLS